MLGHSSDIPGPPPTRDALSEVLADLRLTGVSYGRCELSRPWGIEFPAQREARFHFVASGSCWLRSPSGEWIALGPGDVVLIPHGTGHALGDAPSRRTRALEQFPLDEIGDRTFRLRAGGAGAGTLLACGTVRFEQSALHPLLALMPAVLLVRRAASTDGTLPVLLDTLSDEVLGQRIGAATVMTRLADVVVARVIRAWAEERSGDDATGWLAAIRDPRIGRALAAIHRQPGHPWSIEGLAEVAATSRSGFSERFTALMGMSPGRYLSRWRMHLASSWLRDQRLGVAEVARRLGYDSEAAFSRAFKRSVGTPPSVLRRAAVMSGR
jgi:AraC-like DNA-binding protein